MSCPTSTCACGDRLIHQTRRGKDESSSAYGQHVHEDHPKTFHWADVDGVLYKLDTGIMRIIEHKPIGQGISDSQRAILPLLAGCVDILVDQGVLHPESGVFIVNSDPPYEQAIIRRYRRDDDGRWVPGRSGDAPKLEGEPLRAFETGESVPELS
jgi:hypothetical protein